MIVLLLTVTDVSTTSAVVICRVKVSCITSVTTARVVQTSVTVNNSPIQDYVHPDDHAYSTYFLVISCYDLGHKNCYHKVCIHVWRMHFSSPPPVSQWGMNLLEARVNFPPLACWHTSCQIETVLRILARNEEQR